MLLYVKASEATGLELQLEISLNSSNHKISVTCVVHLVNCNIFKFG
jgi:hypothetical protein